MPTREEFASDIESLRKIDEYKKEYFSSLRLKRTVVSTDIMPRELHEYNNIYLDLLINLFEVNDNSNVLFDKINEPKNEDLELCIKCYKLKLYLDNIREYIVETKLRLIALNEILNEINNLSHLFLSFNIEEETMLKEIHNYLSDIATTRVKEVLVNIASYEVEFEEEIVNSRLNEVREMAILVIPDIVGYLESLDLEPKMLIASIEKELEIYVYTHKNKLKELRKDAESLNTDLLYLDFEDIKDKEEILERIKALELEYKIFSIYGRDLVSFNDLEELYENKYWVLISCIFKDCNFNILNEVNFTELECYQNMVMIKINDIVKGNIVNVNLWCSKYKEETKKIIENLIDVLKSNEEFSFYEILNNRILLALIAAISCSDDWLNYFFQNTMVNIKDYPDAIFYLDIFNWEEVVPLASVYEMKQMYNFYTVAMGITNRFLKILYINCICYI